MSNAFTSARSHTNHHMGGTPTPAPSPIGNGYVAWDRAHVQPSGTISADGLSFYQSVNTASQQGVIGNTYLTGKCYWEIQAYMGNMDNASGFGGYVTAGIAQREDLTADSLTAYAGNRNGTFTSAVSVYDSSDTWTKLADVAIGNPNIKYKFAFDSVTRNVWVGLVGGSWVGGGDPIAGTGPTYTLSATENSDTTTNPQTAYYYPFVAWSSVNTNGSGTITAVFDSASFLDTPPSGFGPIPLKKHHYFPVQWNSTTGNIGSHVTLSNGNLNAIAAVSTSGQVAGGDSLGNQSLISLPAGAGYYYEFLVSGPVGAGVDTAVGFSEISRVSPENALGQSIYDFGWYGDGSMWSNGNHGISLPTWEPGDTLMLFITIGASQYWHVWVGKNGVWQGDPVAQTGEAYIWSSQIDITLAAGWRNDPNPATIQLVDPSSFKYPFPTNVSQAWPPAHT